MVVLYVGRKATKCRKKKVVTLVKQNEWQLLLKWDQVEKEKKVDG